MDSACSLTMPVERTTPVLFASPHSGRDYPASFLRQSVLDQRVIRSSEDAFVDLLIDCAPEFGAPLLVARAPRAFIDLNRSADELDPALIDGVRGAAHNPRVSSGLGVVPRVVANGRAIYRGKMSVEQAKDRIDRYWRPYHDKLAQLINETRAQFGEAILLDMHSMPHEALDAVVHPGRGRPDIVLGDRFGAAAAPDIVDAVEAAFTAAGLSVVRNAPFAGAYSAQRYGRPAKGQHVVQIEIDRALYMDEAAIKPNANFRNFRDTLTGVIADLANIGRPGVPLAAE